MRGTFTAQEIKSQARVLATDRGPACSVVDYDALRGIDDSEHRLFSPLRVRSPQDAGDRWRLACPLPSLTP